MFLRKEPGCFGDSTDSSVASKPQIWQFPGSSRSRRKHFLHRRTIRKFAYGTRRTIHPRKHASESERSDVEGAMRVDAGQYKRVTVLNSSDVPGCCGNKTTGFREHWEN
jgi:hypothetical protein